MTALTLAITNQLKQDSALTALLGRSVTFPTWIFDEKPFARIENSQRALIVINEDNQWAQMNEHNHMRFPRILVDIWADPTRNTDNSVKTYDATRKIEAIVKQVDQTMHTVNLNDGNGNPIIWGTAAQKASFTGQLITGSVHLTGPTYSDIKDAEGALMGRVAYGVNTA